MSYDYAARVVFVGRLAAHQHPALYDLCARHATDLRLPRGWVARVEPWAGGGASSQ
jgi:hypothetical protein